MATESALAHFGTHPRGRKRAIVGFLAAALALVVVFAVVVLLWSGVTLAGDPTALAHVSVQPFGGSIEHVEAFGPNGHSIPIAVDGGRLTPLTRLKPGEQVSVDVQVRRPGWLGWALGHEHTAHLTLSTPVAQVSERWMTVRPGSDVRVSFDKPVSAVDYQGAAGGGRPHSLGAGRTSISLGRQASTGTIEVATAARSWESVGSPTQVSWFPPSHSAVMVAFPATGTRIGPATKLYLTFSKPVSEVLGSAHPRVAPVTAGHWHTVNSHTIVFVPSGMGAALGSRLSVQLQRSVSVTGAGGGGLRTTRQVEWTIPPGSTLRLQQMLAQEGYLPLLWHPSGPDVKRTASAEAQAAVDPPSGAFSWRFHDTPHQLQALWSAGQANTITRGAVMKFENENDLTVDGFAGATVWRKLIEDAIARKRLDSGYSYVYVHREVPETMTLWHDGRTIITSPANTGISGAETELGTFPVFEHIPEGTMSGTNPDGSHYEDPGIKWISYFNGGDALHNFDRASFGSPQSLGCVELPLAASAEIWPYTPIGTLVTIEA
jgi:hypothetical protein